MSGRIAAFCVVRFTVIRLIEQVLCRNMFLKFTGGYVYCCDMYNMSWVAISATMLYRSQQWTRWKPSLPLPRI